jgi:antitoxin ChpS
VRNRIYVRAEWEIAMIETKVRRVGNSAVMTLTTEMLAMLDVKEGDSLYVVRGDDGSLRVMAHHPDVAAALTAAEIVMDENRDLLQALA